MSDDIGRQPVLERATNTYCNMMIGVGVATLLSLALTGLSLVTTIGAVLLVVGGLWLAVISWAVWR